MLALYIPSSSRTTRHNIPAAPRNCTGHESAVGCKGSAPKPVPGNTATEKTPGLCLILLILGVAQRTCPATCSCAKGQQSLGLPRGHSPYTKPAGLPRSQGCLDQPLCSPCRQMSQGCPYPASARGSQKALLMCSSATTHY